jgi:predicted metal-dependent phosphoesterase TrpH
MDKINYKSRIISSEQAREHIKDGYFALDPHCHTSYSYDVPDAVQTNPENVIKVQKNIGLRPLVSDHDTLNGYNYLKRKGYSKIIPAVELTFRPKIARKVNFNGPMHTLHINIFGLNNNDLVSLKDIAHRGDLDELVRYLKHNDLDWMYNHPFWHEKHEHLNWRVIPGLAKNYFDIIELNGTFSRSMNDIALRMAQNLNKGVIASSDSHTGKPGIGYVIAEGKNFKEFWENVKNKKMYVMRRDMGTLDIVREGSLMISQAVNAKIRPINEKKFTPSTDFKPFNTLMRSLTSGSLKNKLIIKKVIQMVIQSINYTAGPILIWKFYVSKDDKNAEYIRRRIALLTHKTNLSKLNHKKYSTKIRKDNTIL